MSQRRGEISEKIEVWIELRRRTGQIIVVVAHSLRVKILLRYTMQWSTLSQDGRRMGGPRNTWRRTGSSERAEIDFSKQSTMTCRDVWCNSTHVRFVKSNWWIRTSSEFMNLLIDWCSSKDQLIISPPFTWFSFQVSTQAYNILNSYVSPIWGMTSQPFSDHWNVFQLSLGLP